MSGSDNSVHERRKVAAVSNAVFPTIRTVKKAEDVLEAWTDWGHAQMQNETQ